MADPKHASQVSTLAFADGESVAFLVAENLRSAMPGLRHGFSFCRPRQDDGAMARAIGEALGLDRLAPGGGLPWVFAQPHGSEVLDLGSEHARSGDAAPEGLPARLPVPNYDGAMARLAACPPGARSAPTLIVKGADCVSVLAVHAGLRAYAALHAGWRGAAAGILPRLLSAWRAQKVDPGGIHLAFGPHIRACCFEVREDCLARFTRGDLEGALTDRNGRIHLNLERVLRTQAAVFGVRDDRIEVLPYCTRCFRDEAGAYPFASYRRAQQEGVQAGRNLGFIGPLP